MDNKSLCMWPSLTLLATALVAPHAHAASNFTISPTAGRAFPTSIQAGSTVSAFYTITNNTRSTRNGYSITGLPASVTVNSTGSTCTSPVTLAAYASCMVQLDISSPVQSNFALCYKSNCTSASVPLNVAAASGSIVPLVAGGFYNNTNMTARIQPIIIASGDNGASWSYTFTSANLPSGPVAAQVYSVSCTTTACYAVGGIANPSAQIFPAMLKGTALGTDWAVVDLPDSGQPSGRGGLSSISCTESVCVAAGTAGNVAPPSLNNGEPIIYTSTDGVNWTIPTIAGTPPVAGAFTNVYCNTNACVAIGGDNTNSFIAYGSSTGTNWNYANTGVAPGDFQHLYGVHCNNQTCIAGGYYIDSSVFHPYLLVSNNNGQTWTEATINGAVAANLQLNSVYCTNSACMAVGSDATSIPLLVLGPASGANWNYTAFPLPPGASGAHLNAINCTNTYCVIAGDMVTGGTFPMSAIGTVNGTGWNYTLTDTSIAGSLGTITCNANICFSGGSSIDPGVPPLAYLSSNNGGSWTSVIATLPADYADSGTFFSTNVGTLNSSYYPFLAI